MDKLPKLSLDYLSIQDLPGMFQNKNLITQISLMTVVKSDNEIFHDSPEFRIFPTVSSKQLR